MGDDCMDLPPGFRFHPTDEEIITNYLLEKIFDQSFNPRAIGVANLNKCEPWDLPSKAKMGVKEWYFFCLKDRKYPTGMRTNRATEAGYWKATGKDKEIRKGKGVLVGMKKTLVFYKGRAPKGEKTNWVMHEFRLEGNSYTYNLPKSSKDEWVVSRVFHKSTAGAKTSPVMNKYNDYLLDSPPYFIDSRGPVSIEDGGCDMKGISSSMTSMDDRLGLHKNHLYPQNQLNHSMFLSQLPPLNPLPFTSAAANFGYLHRDDDSIGVNSIDGQCKVEQVISSSMVSPPQNTGLSADKTIDVSSYNGDPSAGQVAGLEDLWEY